MIPSPEFLDAFNKLSKAQKNDMLDMLFKTNILELWSDMFQNTCSDCKDGYYYPLVGPRERCKTCQ